MKIEIRKTKENGVTQITTLDERWYSKTVDDVLYFNPSITWVARYAPMPPALLKWYADKGMDEAEQVKRDAGEKGSKVHQAIESLLLGNEVKLEDGFKNPDTGVLEELTPDEYWCIMTFAAFWEDYNKEHEVKLIDTEQSVWVNAGKGEKYGYAGTRDFKVLEDGKPKIWDIKTSKDVHLGHEVQLSALKHADPDDPAIAIIQVGYARNKNGWKVTDIEDKFHLFQASKLYWLEANPEAKPKQKDYPSKIVLSNTMLDNLGK